VCNYMHAMHRLQSTFSDLACKRMQLDCNGTVATKGGGANKFEMQAAATNACYGPQPTTRNKNHNTITTDARLDAAQGMARNNRGCCLSTTSRHL
jgi:hypothetical protein